MWIPAGVRDPDGRNHLLQDRAPLGERQLFKPGEGPRQTGDDIAHVGVGAARATASMRWANRCRAGGSSHPCRGSGAAAAGRAAACPPAARSNPARVSSPPRSCPAACRRMQTASSVAAGAGFGPLLIMPRLEMLDGWLPTTDGRWLVMPLHPAGTGAGDPVAQTAAIAAAATSSSDQSQVERLPQRSPPFVVPTL
jgi:hypothetical protein